MVGIDIHEHTAIKATAIAIYAISTVLKAADLFEGNFAEALEGSFICVSSFPIIMCKEDNSTGIRDCQP